MANKNDVKKALEIIRKNGDMYEAIAKALNNNPTKMWLLRYNLLFFSRILYMGALLKDQIVVHFAPVDKVHEAQEVIRKALGFKADIINSSFANIVNPFLAFVKKDPYILYENASSKEEFCYNMNKLLTFCQFYNIKGIYLSEKDLTSLFPYINMSEYKIRFRSEIFEIRNMELGEDRFYKMDFNELIKLVKLLRNDAAEKKSITYFGSKINDEAIKQALENYEKDNNLTNLKAMVSARFSLALNSDSTYKTKDLGKTSDIITLQGNYLQILSITNDGIILDSSVKTIWDFFGYSNIEALINDFERRQDNEELMAIASLYLYLYNDGNFYQLETPSPDTYYDKVYNSYLEYKNNKKNKSKFLPSKGNKILTELSHSIVAFYLSLAILGTAVLSFHTLGVVTHTDIGDKAINFVHMANETYYESFNFEINLLQSIMGDEVSAKFGNLLSLLDNKNNKEYVGDATVSEDKKIAEVWPTSGNEEMPLPQYYASGFATASKYQNGQIAYDIENVELKNAFMIPFDDALFCVKTDITKEELKNAIDEERNINFTIPLYPVGESYYLTRVVIGDGIDTNLFAVIYYPYQTLTDEELDKLNAMTEPMVLYCYNCGIFTNDNSFVDSYRYRLERLRANYLDLPFNESKKIITESLGLKEDAEFSEIISAISSKYYSKTPIKDAKLSSKIKDMDEKEYLKTIASLDSLVCNLAATLTVEASDDTLFVEGYYLDTSKEDVHDITTGTAHAWAMDYDGLIYDSTPTTKAPEKDDPLNIILGAIRILAIGAIITLIARKGFNLTGKKIIFIINKNRIEKLLSSEQMKDVYSLINELQYGGINIPVQKTTIETFDQLTSDFEGYTKEELQELLKKLKESKSPFSKQAIKVIKKVPYIKSNEEELGRKLKKE